MNGRPAHAHQALKHQLELEMKRIIAAVLFASTALASAHADTSTYYWQGKGPRSDARLQAAAQVCDQRYGVVQNGAVTSANYKRCMLQQGWQYGFTAREKSKSYIDPDSGMSCQNEGGVAVCDPPQGTVRYFDPDQGLWCTRTGIASICSNL
jgi:hypothetical protein